MHPLFSGAGDEARTRYLHLGKVALYRMSYTRGTRCIITRIPKKSSIIFRFFENFLNISAHPIWVRRTAYSVTSVAGGSTGSGSGLLG